MKHNALMCAESKGAVCPLDRFIAKFKIPLLKSSFSHLRGCASLYLIYIYIYIYMCVCVCVCVCVVVL